MFLFATDAIIAWAAVVGICLVILGVRPSLPIWLVSPAVIHWLLMPVFVSLAKPAFALLLQHWGVLVVLAILAPFVALSLAARLIESFLKLFLGPVAGGRAAGHMFGTWGVRFADWLLGRGPGRPIPDWVDEDEG